MVQQSAITIEALLVLDAIDRRGSFAAAAEQLNKVPSALSYIVQKLEEQLSVTIFTRQGRRSVLTPAGRHLLEEGRKVLAVVNKVAEQTQTISHGWEPKIRVAFDSIVDCQRLFPLFSLFLDQHPNIELDLSEQVMNGTWEALSDDRVDLVVGAPSPVPVNQGIRSQSIGRYSMVLVVNKKHQLSRLNRPAEEQDIQKYRTVVVHDSVLSHIPRSSNVIQHSRHFCVTSVEHKIKAILAGVGAGYLPRERIQGLLNLGELIAIDTEKSPTHVELNIAWKTVNKGRGLKRLVELLTQNPII